MEVKLWPIDRLMPYARNPRKNDQAVDRMCASIQEFGFKIPCLVRSDGEVVDGHLRLKAARRLGLIEVPVILCDEWSPAQVKAFRLLVNRSVNWAAWDEELLAVELEEIQGLGFDLELTVVEVTTTLSQWVKGDFEALIILWSGRVDLDANLYSFNACDGSLNGSKYCNPRVDGFLKEARSVTDYEQRYGAYEKATGILLTELPYIYLWHPAMIYGVSQKIDGFRLVPDSLVRVVGLTLRP